MNLIDHFRADIEGLKGDEFKLRIRLWHNAARRYCNLLGITADPAPDFIHLEEEGVTVKPVDAAGGRFFLKASLAELCELYRVTAPRRYRRA